MKVYLTATAGDSQFIGLQFSAINARYNIERSASGIYIWFVRWNTQTV